MTIITDNGADAIQIVSADLPEGDELEWQPCGAPDGFELDDTTENVNRVLAAIDQGLRPKTRAQCNLAAAQPPVDTIPTDPEVWNWEDAPLVQPRRSFRVVRVEKISVFVKAAGVPVKQGHNVQCWAIWVKDDNSDNDTELQLFGAAPVPTRLHQQGGGQLTQSICPSDREAHQLGDLACKLLDRLPIPIDPVRWNRWNGTHVITERRLVQAHALDVWKHPFRRSQLPAGWRDLELSDFAGVDHLSNAGALRRRVRCWYTDVTSYGPNVSHRLVQSSIRITIHSDQLDFAKLAALPDAPRTFTYGLTATTLEGLPTNATQAQRSLLLKAYRILLHAVAFKVGTTAGVQRLVDSIMAKFSRAGRQSVLGYTPRVESDRSVSLVPGDFVTKLADGTLPILIIRNASSSMAKVAYVLEQIISAMRNGEKIVNVHMKGARAADEVSLERISFETICQRHCRCDKNEANMWPAHVCMGCHEIHACILMKTTEDSRLLCPNCSNKDELTKGDVPVPVTTNMPRPAVPRPAVPRPAVPRPTVPRTAAVRAPFLRRLGYMMNNVSASEHKAGGIENNSASRQLLRDQIYSSVIDIEKGVWKDMYAGERNDEDARYEGTWPRSTDGKLVPHAAQASIDAIKPFILADGRLTQHHDRNVGLTTLGINHAKADSPACILPALRALAWHAANQEDVDPALPDPFQASLNRHMDRVHHIQQLVPRAVKTRLAGKVSETEMATYLESCRTSLLEPDQKSPISEYKREKYTSGETVKPSYITKGGSGPMGPKMLKSKAKVAAALSKQHPTIYLPFTDEQKATLLRFIVEIERDYNPYGIKIPRGGGDAPWPFVEEHMFKDKDLWEWWFHEMVCRYWRMFWMCNVLFDTDEIPMTLLLLIVIQYFKTGGRYGWLRCEMTVFAGHAFRYVFARAGHVTPGSVMKTGFKTTTPTSMSDYDERECTIVVQPHFVNMLWYNFPTGEHHLLLRLLRELAAETEHYTAFSSDAPPAPSYPQLSKYGRKQAGVTVSDDQYPELDEEDERLRQLEEEDERLRQFEEEENEEGGEWNPFRPLEEDEYDEESGNEASPEEEQEQDPLMTTSLSTQYRVWRGFLAANYPGYQLDEAVQGYLRVMRLARDRNEPPRFLRYSDQLMASLTANSDTCCVCREPFEDDELVVKCSNGKHIDAYFHTSCGADPNQAGGDDQEALCPNCIAKQPKKPSKPVKPTKKSLKPQPEKPSKPAEPTEIPRRWNLQIINNTCYIDSSVVIFIHLPQMHAMLSIEKSIIAKPEQESGRSGAEYLPNIYGSPPTLAGSADYMNHALRLYKKVADINKRVRSGPFDRQHSVKLFEFARAVNPEEWLDLPPPDNLNEQNVTLNDTFDLWRNLLEAVNVVTDDSLPSGRSQEASLTADGDFDDEGKLRHYSRTSPARMLAYTEQGKASPITKFFSHQDVVERQCNVAECASIARSYEHGHSFVLYLPPDGSDVADYALPKMLAHRHETSSELPLRCPVDPKQHPNKLAVHRKMTMCPEILTIQISRKEWKEVGGVAKQSLKEDHIDIPEYLDLSPFAHDAKLPSDKDSEPDGTARESSCIYRLTSLNMYSEAIHHYVAYVLVDDMWLLFDDLPGGGEAVPKHPQAGINKGEVPCVLIYQQQKGKKQLPINAAEDPITGHTLKKNATPPKAKVRDLYLSVPVVDEEDAGFEAGEGADPDEMDLDIQCKQCDQRFPNLQALYAHAAVAHVAKLHRAFDAETLRLVDGRITDAIEKTRKPFQQLFEKLAGSHGELYELMEQARDEFIEVTTAARTKLLQDVADARAEAMVAITQERVKLSEESAANTKLSQETAEATTKSLQDIADARAEAMAAIAKSSQETAGASAKLSQEMTKWWSDGSKRERQVQEKHDARLEEMAQEEAALLAGRKDQFQEAIKDLRTAAESDHQRHQKEFVEGEARVKLMSDELLAEKEQINEMSAKLLAKGELINEMSAKLRVQETQLGKDMFEREAETKKRLHERGAEIETKLEQKFANREAQMKEDMEVALRARAEIELVWVRNQLQNTTDEIEKQRKRDVAQDQLDAIEEQEGEAKAAAERLAARKKALQVKLAK
jgi:hypothetical protein